MAANIRMWQVTTAGPRRVGRAVVNLEQDLEDWIQADPSLVADGLTIIARQLTLDAGRLDLLAFDPVGRIAVIEVKKGQVYRKTVAQLLDYVASLARIAPSDLLARLRDNAARQNVVLPLDLETVVAQAGEEPIPVIGYVAGVGAAPGLDQLVEYLSDHDITVGVVSFEAFELPGVGTVITREVTESSTPEPESTAPSLTMEQLQTVADSSGVGDELRILRAAAERNGVPTRLWKGAVMFAVPSDRRKMLWTAWAQGEPDGLKMYPSAVSFAENFPVSEEEVQGLLGPHGWRHVRVPEAQRFADGLDQVFELIRSRTRDGEE